MLPVDYLPGARRDFDESFDWYAERSKQAAERFVNAVDAALTVIAAYPQRFAEIDIMCIESAQYGGFLFALFTGSSMNVLLSWQ